MPRDQVELERRAADELAGRSDDELIPVRVLLDREIDMVLPIALVRRYLQAQGEPGRQLLVFDADEEVSTQVAAEMLGMSRPSLVELLEGGGGMPFHTVGNQRRVYVRDIEAFRQYRANAQAGLEAMADIANESGGGWN